MEELTYKIVALIFGTGGIGFYLIKWYLNRKDGKKDITQLLTGISNMYSKMQQLLNETEANRFLILKAENGGGKPKVGCTINVSVLYEVVNGLRSVKDDYQKLPVDPNYIVMLSEASLHGHSSMVVKEMEPCMLKDIYVDEGVLYSEVHYLCETDLAFYYCSVASTVTTNFSGGRVRNRITLSVNYIRNVMKKLV